MEKPRMILISIDSMINDDLEILRRLSNFGTLLRKASTVKNMLTTYPSYTHSIHTSISTGCYPGSHGVISNEHFEPGVLEPTWFEDYRDVKRPTFAQEAHKRGYSVAHVFWPLTLHEPMEWNLHRAGIHVIPDNEQQIIRERSSAGFFDEVYPYIKHAFNFPVRDFRSDEICFSTVEYLIDNHQPDLIQTHIIAIDNTRHHHCVYSRELHEAYAYLDEGLGRILAALRRQNLQDDTIVAITSDHGHLDIRKVLSINRFFLDHGLIELDENGQVRDWKAWFQTCSLSGHVYIKNNDETVAKQVFDLLDQNRDMLEIERIFTKEEAAREWHLEGGFTYVIESYGNTSFSANYHWEFITPLNNASYRTSLATHGHLPYKGVQPCFILVNPFHPRQVHLDHGRVIDQAPTLARCLGFAMTTCDGKPIEELLG